MTTRADFLADGLESVPNPNQTVECLICKAEPSDSLDLVRLPCHPTHVFDRACVVTWLKQWGVNTCPICRTAIFELAEEEQEDDDDDFIEDEEEEEQDEEANEQPRQVSAHVQRLEADMLELLNQGDEMSKYDPDEEASQRDADSDQGSDGRMDDELDEDSEDDPEIMDLDTEDSDSELDSDVNIDMKGFVEEDSDDDDSGNWEGDGGDCSDDSDDDGDSDYDDEDD